MFACHMHTSVLDAHAFSAACWPRALVQAACRCIDFDFETSGRLLHVLLRRLLNRCNFLSESHPPHLSALDYRCTLDESNPHGHSLLLPTRAYLFR